jgi:hypothetical protein
MNMYLVHMLLAKEGRERKHRVALVAVIAESLEAAIEKAKAYRPISWPAIDARGRLHEEGVCNVAYYTTDMEEWERGKVIND